MISSLKEVNMKKIFATLWTTLILLSCSQEPKDTYRIYELKNTNGLLQAFRLDHQETRFYPEDYFHHPELIDTVIWPSGLKMVADSGDYWILKGNIDQAWDFASFYRGQQRADLIIRKSLVKQYRFEFDPSNFPAEIKEIRVFGAFNLWNSLDDPCQFDGTHWVKEFELTPGVFDYKLIVNGSEMLDPQNPDSIPNGFGGFNSRLTVAQADLPTEELHSLEILDHAFTISKPPSSQKVIAFWNNVHIPVIPRENDLYIEIPKEADLLERSFIRIYSGNKSIASNDLLIPVSNGQVVTSTEQLSRNDWHRAVMYFMMVDRFSDGNQNNNVIDHDPEVLPKARWQGGDLAGITQKLEEGYFEDLGINTVWVSPIVKNPEESWGLWDMGGVTSKFSGYHGYWPVSSTTIDPRFGSADDFSALIEASHRRDMNVLLDYVANHVHEDHPIYQQHPDWATNLYLPDGSLNTERWDDQRLTTWFDTFLPTLDLRRADVVEPMTDSAMVWLQEFELDGFRHDATKHIDELYWRVLTGKIRQYLRENDDRKFYQIGETYGSPMLIQSYVNNGMLDAQFDFNMYDASLQAFASSQSDPYRLKEIFYQSMEYYGYNHLMGNMSGNQDRSRYISLVSGDVLFDEDQKLAGWTRDITRPADRRAYERMNLLMAYNMFIPGIPCIYYGDEYGMHGANDPDNRKMMQFEELTADEQWLLSETRKWTRLRTSKMALLYGSASMEISPKGLIVLRRKYFDQDLLLLLNPYDSAIEWESAAEGSGDQRTVVEGRSALFIEMNQAK
jgi:glycosidase